jgi:putative addiction module killer protein
MNAPVRYDLRHYLTAGGRDLYEEWLEDLTRYEADRVDAYVTRMEGGNFGASRSIGGGVLELKINVGPGYRVYYLRDGERVVVLLCGGDKSSQPRDVRRARACAADYWRRA